MAHIRLLALGLVGVLALTSCSALEQQEATYKDRVLSIDRLIARSDGDLKKEMEQRKAAWLAEYAALPKTEKERSDGLGKLCQSSREFLLDADKRVAAAEAARAGKESEEAKKLFLSVFAGEWKSPEMTLVIGNGGMVQYSRMKDGSKREMNAPIRSIGRNQFDIGIFGINTTFKIDKLPRQEGDVWKMTVDGVELTRQSAP